MSQLQVLSIPHDKNRKKIALWVTVTCLPMGRLEGVRFEHDGRAGESVRFGAGAWCF